MSRVYEDQSRAFIEFVSQPGDFAHRPTDPIDAHCRDTVLLDSLAAFNHDVWDLYTIAGHLFCEIDAKCRPGPIGEL